MRLLSVIAAVCICLLASGCGVLKGLWEDQSYGVAAAKICTQDDKLDKDSPCYGFGEKGVNLDTVWQTIASSQENCCAFVNGLVASEIGTNSVLDMSTTAFSALGTALTPLAAVHAMTAASTMTSGWKTALDSDVFARASIANYAQAIQSTYYKELSLYVSDLESRIRTNKSGINAWAELARIQAIHAQCSLASAQSSISAALQSGPPSSSPATADTTVTLSGKPKNGETLQLIAKWGPADNPTTEVVELRSLKAKMTIAQIVSGLKDKVNDDTVLKAAHIVALPGTTSESFVLRSPQAADVNWRKGGTSQMKLELSAPADSGAPAKTSGLAVPGRDPKSIQ